jgi:MOSC domain-containing protein YiiM
MQQNNDSRVVAIALRPARKVPMQEVSAVQAAADGGLDGDHPASPDRGITLLAKAQWDSVVRELGVNLPWHTRRANVLVEGMNLAELIGKTVHLGEIEVAVKAETKPCARMDEIHPGLRAALEPDCRGGVYGRITVGGSITVGDAVVASD